MDKRQKKMDQHYTIMCNGLKVKILRHKLTKNPDGKTILEIITKIPNRAFSQSVITFDMCDEEKTIFSCTWYSEWSQPGLKRYLYEVSQ